MLPSLMNDYTQLLSCDSLYLDTCALVKIEFDEGLTTNLARFLTFGTEFQIYSSYLAFGEFVSVSGRKEEKEKLITSVDYLAICRRLMIDFDMNTIKRFEPFENGPKERIDFEKHAASLFAKYPNLGGGDLWHLIAAIRLKKENPNSGFLTFDKKLSGAASQEGVRSFDGSLMDLAMVEAKLKAAGKVKV